MQTTVLGVRLDELTRSRLAFIAAELKTEPTAFVRQCIARGLTQALQEVADAAATKPPAKVGRPRKVAAVEPPLQETTT